MRENFLELGERERNDWNFLVFSKRRSIHCSLESFSLSAGINRDLTAQLNGFAVKVLRDSSEVQ